MPLRARATQLGYLILARMSSISSGTRQASVSLPDQSAAATVKAGPEFLPPEARQPLLQSGKLLSSQTRLDFLPHVIPHCPSRTVGKGPFPGGTSDTLVSYSNKRASFTKSGKFCAA